MKRIGNVPSFPRFTLERASVPIQLTAPMGLGAFRRRKRILRKQSGQHTCNTVSLFYGEHPPVGLNAKLVPPPERHSVVDRT